MFNAKQISEQLCSSAKNIVLEIIEETDSTNTELMRRAGNFSAPLFLLALNQTAGRGRNNKTWHAEPGASLTFSLAWPFYRPLHALSGTSLVVGLSVAGTLEKMGISVKLKWPNDLLKDGKKLGGILIEVPPAAKQPDKQKNWCIIGIGLNLALPVSLEKKIGQSAAYISSTPLDPHFLIASLLNDLATKLLLFDDQGLDPFVDDWDKLHLYTSRKIIICQDGLPQKTGIALGIDKYGRLLLDCEGKTETVSAGEISLRPFKR